MKIKLIVEDRYGGDFFKNVIIQLKENGLVDKNIIIPKPKHLSALCNTKLEPILRAVNNTCDRIIIILDADSPQNREERYAKTQCHIPANIKTPIKIVITDYEIEEWICISKNLKWHSKPSEELKNKFKYTKSRLPRYASELDFEVLMKKKCKSFISFLNALKP